jgi:hypothetical protein
MDINSENVIDLIEDEESSPFEEFKPDELKLDEEQNNVIKKILDPNGGNVFITGGAGVGKSLVLQEAIKILKSMEVKILVTAPTGISSININGVTINSAFGIGFGQDDMSVLIKKCLGNKIRKQELRTISILFIDEISMVSPRLFYIMDMCLQEARGNPLPFGGVKVVVVGDFFQLPPIPTNKDTKPVLQFITDSYNLGNPIEFCFETPNWKNCKFNIFELKNIHRQNDKTFIDLLNDIRIGKITEQGLKIINSCIAKNPVDPYNLGCQITPENRTWVTIYTKNIDVDNENNEMLKKIEGEEYTYEMTTDYVVLDNSKKYIYKSILEKALELFKKDCTAPQKLKLKVGATVMLLKNLDFSTKGSLVNGLCGKVKSIEKATGYPYVEFENGRRSVISFSSWTRTINGIGEISITQIPLKLGYAITAHKSQGQSIKTAVVNPLGTFQEGQFYVSLSRLTGMDGLRIIGFKKEYIMASKKVKDFYNSITSLLSSPSSSHKRKLESDKNIEYFTQQQTKKNKIN